MKTLFNTVASLLAACALMPNLALAATPDLHPNPYEHIAASNVFRLLPPQPVHPDQPAPPPRRPLPKIFITGLIELHGSPRALLKIDKPGQSAQSAILAAGGACDVVEMLDIDVPGEKVHLRVDGTEETLTLEPPKASASVGPGPSAAPRLPPPVPAPLFGRTVTPHG